MYLAAKGYMYLDVKVRLSNKFWARHLPDTVAMLLDGATAHHPGPSPGDPDQAYFVDETTDELNADSRRNACLVLRSS
jgi:hypothetical protein